MLHLKDLRSKHLVSEGLCDLVIENIKLLELAVRVKVHGLIFLDNLYSHQTWELLLRTVDGADPKQAEEYQIPTV